MPLFYIKYRPVQASNLRSSGGLLTDAIFPMPPHNVCWGFELSAKKDASRVAQAQPQTFRQFLSIEPRRAARREARSSSCS
jgi:hypothetical protein